MRTWRKAALIACMLELPLLLGLATVLATKKYTGIAWDLFGAVHAPAAIVAQYVLLIWNPGPRPGPTTISTAVAFLVMYVFQITWMTPTVYGLIELTKILRNPHAHHGSWMRQLAICWGSGVVLSIFVLLLSINVFSHHPRLGPLDMILTLPLDPGSLIYAAITTNRKWLMYTMMIASGSLFYTFPIFAIYSILKNSEGTAAERRR